jgi:hypothetical protein
MSRSALGRLQVREQDLLLAQIGLPYLKLLVKLVPGKVKGVLGVRGHRDGVNGEGLVAGGKEPKDQQRTPQAPERLVLA